MANNNPASFESTRLAVVLERLISLCSQNELKLDHILTELSISGHMLVCLVFASPFLLPIPLPGLSTLFGFVICMAAIQMFLGIQPWLPRFIRERTISTSILKSILNRMLRILNTVERFIRPRFTSISAHPISIRIHGLTIFLIGLLLSLPMPPGFNTPPALAIMTICVGTLERDGLITLAGYVLSVLNIMLFSAFFLLGFEGLKALLGFI